MNQISKMASCDPSTTADIQSDISATWTGTKCEKELTKAWKETDPCTTGSMSTSVNSQIVP